MIIIRNSDIVAILEQFSLTLGKSATTSANFGVAPAHLIAEAINALITERTPDPNQGELPLAVVVLAGDAPGCKVRVEQDERVCSNCGLRWDTGEKSPACAGYEGLS